MAISSLHRGPIYNDKDKDHRTWLLWEFLRREANEGCWGKIAERLNGKPMNELSEIIDRVWQQEQALAAAESDRWYEAELAKKLF